MKHAVVAVIQRGPHLLIIRRGPRARRAGYWGFVTGTLEPGETQQQALEREVREEVGLVVRPLRKVWESVTDTREFRLHWWAVELQPQAEPAPEPDEVSEIRWLTAGEFLRLDPTFDGDRYFVERVLPGLTGPI